MGCSFHYELVMSVLVVIKSERINEEKIINKGTHKNLSFFCMIVYFAFHFFLINSTGSPFFPLLCSIKAKLKQTNDCAIIVNASVNHYIKQPEQSQ